MAVYPETKQKSLEELAAYFGETVVDDQLEQQEEREKGGIEHAEMVG